MYNYQTVMLRQVSAIFSKVKLHAHPSSSRSLADERAELRAGSRGHLATEGLRVYLS